MEIYSEVLGKPAEKFDTSYKNGQRYAKKMKPLQKGRARAKNKKMLYEIKNNCENRNTI